MCAVFILIGAIFATIGGAFSILSYLDNGKELLKNDDIFIATAFFAIGVLFLSIGIGMLSHFAKRKRLAAYLRQFGRRIEAHGVMVTKGWLKINGRPSYRIICRVSGPLMGERVLKSDLLWFNPIDKVTSDKICVFVDITDPKKYWVDISALSRES